MLQHIITIILSIKHLQTVFPTLSFTSTLHSVCISALSLKCVGDLQDGHYSVQHSEVMKDKHPFSRIFIDGF